MKSQGGFASFETILVVMIIATLATIAVPNMTRMVDVARVDYEMKILLSNLDYAYSLNKNSHYSPSIFEGKLSGQAGHPIYLNVNYARGTYQIEQNGERVDGTHELPQGFSIERNSTLENPIKFDSQNKGHIIITSSYNVKRYVVRNTVGRWRGDVNPPK